MREPKSLDAPAGREVRLSTLSDVEVRSDGDGPIEFKGVAAVVNSQTRIGRSAFGFYEELRAGAFEDSIAADDIRMLKNHNTDLILARNTAGNLRLKDTAKGLAVDADMTPTTYARDLGLSLAAGDISQMSFGFEVLDEEWITLDEDHELKGTVVEPELRVIKRVKLWEVSPVTFPAYTDTEAGLRSVEEFDALMDAPISDLKDERVMALAAEVRSITPDPEKIRALAKGLAAPAIEPTATRRSNREQAAALFPSRFGTKE